MCGRGQAVDQGARVETPQHPAWQMSSCLRYSTVDLCGSGAGIRAPNWTCSPSSTVVHNGNKSQVIQTIAINQRDHPVVAKLKKCWSLIPKHLRGMASNQASSHEPGNTASCPTRTTTAAGT